jgi:tetratricopeptide (TPR) repeat protein
MVMVWFQRVWVASLIWILALAAGFGDSWGAVNKKNGSKDLPGVETKIKQVPGLGGQATPHWKILWEKARQEVLQKKYLEAIQDFRQALTLKPNLDEARQELAQVLLILERWGEAIGELEIVVEHQPSNQKAQKDLANLLSQRKEYRRANEIYQRLLLKDPDNLVIRLSLAANYYQINELEKAMIEWRQVLIRDAQHVEARTHLAEALGATKRLDEAVLILEGLVKQFPKQASFKKKLAQALVSSQRNKEALPYLQELIRQDPTDLEIQLALAQVLSAGKNYNQSLSYLDTYLKKKPDSQSALLEKARALVNTGNYSEALEVYEKLKKIEPDNLELRRESAEAYFTSGKIQEALSEFETLVKHFPEDVSLYEKIGGIYFQNKNYSRAIPAFQKILSLEPDHLEAQLNLVRALNYSGEKEKALPLYRTLLEKRSDQNLQMELADLLFEMQRFAEAFQIYRQLLEKSPDLWEVRYKLAMGLYRQKEFNLAARQLEELTRLRPDQPMIWNLAGNNAFEQGDYRQAQKAFQKVLTLGDDRSNILLRLGEIWRLLGRPWKGISYLDWALTIKPTDQEIALEKAMALIDGGGLAQARRILEPLIQSNPKSFKTKRAWIRLMAALDRSEEAEIAWEQMEKSFPQEQDLLLQDRADFYSRKGKRDLALTVLKGAQIKNPKNLEIQRKIGRLTLQLGRWEEAETYYRNLEKGQILLDEVYWAQAFLLIRQEQYALAQERLWQALMKAADSVRIRFWLWWLYNQDENRVEEAKKIREALIDFSRDQDGGLLELADCYLEVNDSKKAEAIYKELMEKGEDDDVLLSLNRINGLLRIGKRSEELQDTLENVQKRFPRNQKISRLLMEHYTQQKDFSPAVKTIDGLLRVEDSRDPVLIIKKARIMERWNKHGSSQELFQKLLDPSVDLLFKRKVTEFISHQDPLVATLFKEAPEKNSLTTVNPIFEGARESIKVNPLEPKLQEKIKAIIEELMAEDLIQKKVFLEKEGKDNLWRNKMVQARSYLEELRRIDPDNEDVNNDLNKSFRITN